MDTLRFSDAVSFESVHCTGTYDAIALFDNDVQLNTFELSRLFLTQYLA